MAERINRREGAALINSLSAGVVPRIGLRHIAVGREKEVRSFLNDLETVQEGGAAFRFISGIYGSGKTFLLQLVRNNALDRNFVVLDADLSPERRLTGTKHQGLATYRELMQNLSIRSKPDGGGLESVLQKWISGLQMKVAASLNLSPSDPSLVDEVSKKIYEDLRSLSELAYGFTFAEVIESYYKGYKSSDEELKSKALRWLRGEYLTRTEARKALGVDQIIDDANWYDFLKLFARFCRMAGYEGLLVFLDESVNLYKITNKVARVNNYEKILTMFNDTRQGKASGIGVFIGGTPQFITDEERGLYSYDALKSRLLENRFVAQGYEDYTGPVLNISRLTNEELYLLLERLSELHSSYYKYDSDLSSDQLRAFLTRITSRMGAEQKLTPREVTRDFLGLLNILQQNPDSDFDELLKEQKFSFEEEAQQPASSRTAYDEKTEDLFASFEL